MHVQKIVFPTDFSHSSSAALEYATALARDTGAKLLIVHVEDPPVPYGGGEAYFGILEPDHAELSRMLHEVLPTDPEVTVEHFLLRGNGNPATQIVQFADEQHADLIVMGSHGRTGIPRWIIGSVAEGVVRRASCPVLVSKRPDERIAETGDTIAS